MFMTHSTLKRAQEPPFKQSCNLVTARKHVVTDVGVFTHYFMNVAPIIQTILPIPSIGMNLASWLHDSLNGIFQTFCRSIWNLVKPNPSYFRINPLSCNHNECFSCGSTTPFSGLFASEGRFIDFSNSRKPVSSWPDHCSSKFVQPCPCRTIAQSQERAATPMHSPHISDSQYARSHETKESMVSSCPEKLCPPL